MSDNLSNESIIALTTEGGGGVALDTMVRAAQFLAQGVRRGVPFLGRRRLTVVAGDAWLTRSTNLTAELEEPVFICPLAAEPGGSRAMFCLDGEAISFLLEGSLGGDGSEMPKLAKKGLSPPQRAFIDRVATNIVRTLSLSLERAIGLSLLKLPMMTGEKTSSSALVALPLHFQDMVRASSEEKDDEDDFGLDNFDDEPEKDDEDGEEQECKRHGTVILAMSKNALNTARAVGTTKRGTNLDRRLVATLKEVQVDVIAELGRLVLTLGELTDLKIGDTLRLDVGVNAAIDVRVEDEVVFKGQPTTAGSQLAIEIVGLKRHEVDAAVSPKDVEREELGPEPAPLRTRASGRLRDTS